MKKSMKFATALAGAAVVVAGGTAFTAAGTGMPASPIVGYQANTAATGATVTHQSFILAAGDKTKLHEVNFVVDEEIPDSTHTSYLSIIDQGDVKTDTLCVGVYDTDHTDLTCTLSPDITVASVKNTALTVVQD